MLEYIESAEFDDLLVACIRRAFPPTSTRSSSPITGAAGGLG
jgi:hypothetical protein